ncbi:hypothetical protein VNO77_20543 [Canavalia gladiata]|uniref:Uncharacterized protein n=1 Tax=Canavalia gladiata TaxID=3824 RepID=A0AAN9QLI3_CANGL
MTVMVCGLGGYCSDLQVLLGAEAQGVGNCGSEIGSTSHELAHQGLVESHVNGRIMDMLAIVGSTSHELAHQGLVESHVNGNYGHVCHDHKCCRACH